MLHSALLSQIPIPIPIMTSPPENAFTMPSVSVEEPPSELTINLINPPDPSQPNKASTTKYPQPIRRSHHLNAFLRNLFEPILLIKCAGFCLANPVMTLLLTHLGIYHYDSDVPATAPNIIIASILFLTIPVYLYEALVLPKEQSITLSLSTQQMFVTRIGIVQPSITIPLNEIITFSSKPFPLKSKLNSLLKLEYGNYITAHTTGGPIKLGASKASYATAVSQLNQFLLHHRASKVTEMPHRLLQYELIESFRARPVSHDEVRLPALSRLLFRETDSRSFKFVKRNNFPLGLVIAGATRAYMERFITFRGFWKKIYDHALFVPLLFGYYCLLAFCFSRLIPAQWIFSNGTSPRSRIHRFWNTLCGVDYIPVGMYRKVYMKGRRSRREKDIRSKIVREEAAPAMLYTIWFTSDNVKSQKIEGFSEGEVLFLIDQWQRRFPHLFKNEGTEVEVQGGEEVKSLDEKKKQ